MEDGRSRQRIANGSWEMEDHHTKWKMGANIADGRWKLADGISMEKLAEGR
jgi:hypothetical protein